MQSKCIRLFDRSGDGEGWADAKRWLLKIRIRCRIISRHSRSRQKAIIFKVSRARVFSPMTQKMRTLDDDPHYMYSVQTSRLIQRYLYCFSYYNTFRFVEKASGTFTYSSNSYPKERLGFLGKTVLRALSKLISSALEA